MDVNFNLGDTQLIIKKAKKHGLLRNQLAYVLATAYHETAFTVKPVEEAYYLQTKYKWSDSRMDRWRKENLRYYPWHGRGYVQLTWEYNYRRAKEALGANFLADPTLAMNPEYASDIIVLGMKEGWFTGKKLSDYITLAKSDFVGARRIVNGIDKATTIANYARAYDKALLAAGYGVDSVEPELPIGGNEPTPVEPSTPNWLDIIIQTIINLFRRN